MPGQGLRSSGVFGGSYGVCTAQQTPPGPSGLRSSTRVDLGRRLGVGRPEGLKTDVRLKVVGIVDLTWNGAVRRSLAGSTLGPQGRQTQDHGGSGIYSSSSSVCISARFSFKLWTEVHNWLYSNQ